MRSRTWSRRSSTITALVDELNIEHPPADSRLPKVERHTTAAIKERLSSARTLWCPGCTNGIATRAIIDAVLSLGLDPDKVALVAGIGCAGRITAYLKYSTAHTAHGRALAVATGAKLADPSLEVMVVMGDGDCAAIGGNHLIHAARRNIDMTALVFNNDIYGMTGGQAGPTTHEGDLSKTSPFGHPEPAFDICELAHAAGATFVARGTPYAYVKLVQLIAAGLTHKGFSLVEIMSACPTYYGRFNLTAVPADMLKLQQKQAVPVEKYKAGAPMTEEQYPVGVLHHVERTEYIEAYEEVRRRATGTRV